MRSFSCLTLITLFTSLLFGMTRLSTNTESSIKNLTPTPELYNIVWSTQKIPCGTKVTSEMVALVPTRLNEIPIAPTQYLEWAVGKYTNQDIPENVQVLNGAFSDTPVTCCKFGHAC